MKKRNKHMIIFKNQQKYAKKGSWGVPQDPFGELLGTPAAQDLQKLDFYVILGSHLELI